MNEDSVRHYVGKLMPQLDERSRRLFVGGLADLLGRGACVMLSSITGMSRATINRGRSELEQLPEDPKARPKAAQTVQIRKEGAGRPSIEEISPEIKKILLELLDGNTIGNPENPLCWTTKSLAKLQDDLIKRGISASPNTIRRILIDLGFSLQMNQKYIEKADQSDDRDKQFQFINEKCKSFMNEECPVISVDTKKKELIGNYKNNGHEYRPKKDPRKTNGHDFEGELGKAAPYGIYDIGRNEGFVNVGISSDTAEFAVYSIRRWWYTMGKPLYPNAKKLYINADGGGSNGSRNRLWKMELQKLATDTGLEIHVSHFPPGTSKWNKIEHRLFAYISKNWRAKPLETLVTIVSLIAATTTKTGLKVSCVADYGKYVTGIRVSDEEMAPT